MTPKPFSRAFLVSAVLLAAISSPAPARAQFLADMADRLAERQAAKEASAFAAEAAGRAAVEAERMRGGGPRLIGASALPHRVVDGLKASPDPFAGCAPGPVMATGTKVTRFERFDGGRGDGAAVYVGSVRVEMRRAACPAPGVADVVFSISAYRGSVRSFEVGSYVAAKGR